MKQIRMGVFETNSSSVHSLSIMPVENYEKWKKGELLYDTWKKNFATPEEADVKVEGEYHDYESFNNYWANADERYETFENRFTTEHGDEIVVFGYFGMNN